jgi:DNA-binding MltR family transcriptional regulator
MEMKYEDQNPLSAEYIRQMRAESDRGAVLIGAAYIDSALEELLRAYFVDSKAEVARLLTYPGPCSTLSARCDLAYCSGIFGKDMHADIRTVTKIRNRFAHSKHRATFGDKDVSQLCMNLNLVKGMNTEFSGSDPKAVFVMAAGAIILKLLTAQGTMSHRKPGPSLKVMAMTDPNFLGY